MNYKFLGPAVKAAVFVYLPLIVCLEIMSIDTGIWAIFLSLSIPPSGFLAVYFIKKKVNKLAWRDWVPAILATAGLRTILDSATILIILILKAESFPTAISQANLITVLIVTSIFLLMALLYTLVGTFFGAWIFLTLRDKMIFRSTLSASLIYAVAYFILEVLMFFGDRAFLNLGLIKYHHSTESFIVAYLIPPLLLGFISAYFFRRNKGEPSLANLHDIGLLAVLFSFLLLSLPEAFFTNYVTYDWGLIGNVYGDYVRPFEVGTVIFLAGEIYVVKTSISIIPCFIGVLMGTLVFFRPLKLENLKKRLLSSYMVITFVLLLLLLWIAYLQFFYQPPPDPRFPRDWQRLQPIVRSISYNGSAGVFKTSFNNVAGTPVKITNIVVNELYSGQLCNSYLVDGNPEITVKPSSNFTMEALGCNLKSRGDQYRLEISINFTTVVGGVSSSHIESGTIRGNAE